MHSKKIEKLLTKKGYKFYAPNTLDAESVVANYYQVMRSVSDAPDCLTNDKPPQIYVREWLHKSRHPPESEHRGFEIGICNHAPQGWIDFKFYSLGEKEAAKRFEEIESALLATWRTLFALKEQSSVHTEKR
ncbi:MAG: hypothetical protein LH614_09210 [Pyrinomonadaceae bacterium]|nr:hypothetical protein [Pyrinomonadaceae bacterium]